MPDPGYQAMGRMRVARPPGIRSVASFGEENTIVKVPSLPESAGERYGQLAHWPLLYRSSEPVTVTPAPVLAARPTPRYHIGSPDAV